MTQTARPTPGWSTDAGQTGLAPSRPSAPGGEALDRLLIAECLFRYGWAFDERQLDAMLDGFTDDAYWEASVMGAEQVGPFRGRDALREFFGGFFSRQTAQRRHAFTNVVVDELGDDAASAHAYLLLWSSEQARTTVVTTGPYQFRLSRHAGRWLISEVHAGFDSPLDWDRVPPSP